MSELSKIVQRYDKRKNKSLHNLYSPLNPDVYMSQQEKERILIKWIKESNILPVEEKKVLEIGCGAGGNLLQLVKLGFRAENLVANELLEERAKLARELLPSKIDIIVGDASELSLPNESFDIVFQSTVLTSILDYEFKKKLADKMWDLVKPGGGVLWYDFIYDNPKNSDVKGIKINEIKSLFPSNHIKIWRLTLAPPISRRVCKLSPHLYTVLNIFPFLRTHVLCWIQKVE